MNAIDMVLKRLDSIEKRLGEIESMLMIKDKPGRGNIEIITPKDKIYSSELFDILKKIRLDLSKKEEIPAFCIFPDKVLIELASKKPTKYEDLLNIRGIGKSKLDNYGEVFLEAIIDYLKLKN